MAEISPREQIALHEFSVRYRAALAKQNPTPQANIELVKDAVREQYEQEQQAERDQPVAPEPSKEPEEPDMGR